ncbi:voltage-gated chloride channel, partial [Moniliophthora roreri]
GNPHARSRFHSNGIGLIWLHGPLRPNSTTKNTIKLPGQDEEVADRLEVALPDSLCSTPLVQENITGGYHREAEDRNFGQNISFATSSTPPTLNTFGLSSKRHDPPHMYCSRSTVPITAGLIQGQPDPSHFALEDDICMH